MNRKWESIKQEYLFAETFEERRTLAFCAVNIAWAMSKGKGRFPTREFINEFLEASFQYEKKHFQLGELHHIKQHVEKNREVELAQGEMYWSKEFIKQLEKQSAKK
jgi:hypothetical protein